jgi:tRNA-binding protein
LGDQSRAISRTRKPAYKLCIDFGPLGIRKSSAQITNLYAVEHVSGRLVLAVSEVLVLGVPSAAGGDVVLVGPDREVSPGVRLL